MKKNVYHEKNILENKFLIFFMCLVSKQKHIVSRALISNIGKHYEVGARWEIEALGVCYARRQWTWNSTCWTSFLYYH